MTDLESKLAEIEARANHAIADGWKPSPIELKRLLSALVRSIDQRNSEVFEVGHYSVMAGMNVKHRYDAELLALLEGKEGG